MNQPEEPPLRIAILGAGPIGLEATLYARYLGYEVELFEQGGNVAAHVRSWGHVRLFSPFHRNSTTLGVTAIETQDPSWQCPAALDLLLANEYFQRYLQPLAETDLVQPSLRLNTEVVAIARVGWLKGEGVGNPQRASTPFRLLTRTTRKVSLGQTVEEGEFFADVVIDCTGTYGDHNWLGQGGIPAIGECLSIGLEGRERAEGVGGPGAIEYGLPDVLGGRRNQYADRHVLVVGTGYSAATTVVGLAELAASQPKTRIIWVTRKRGVTGRKGETDGAEQNDPELCGPLGRIPGDRLADRDRLAARANALAADSSGPVTWLPGHSVLATQYDMRTHRWNVTLANSALTDGARVDSSPVDGSPVDGPSGHDEIITVQVDQIVANIGYRPNQKIYSELQVPTCYATEGPMRLATKLMAQAETGSGPVDCLDGASHGAESLLTAESNFYLLGAKSYGRRSQFLLSIGFEQIRDLFALVGGREDLDIYATMKR